MAVTTMKLQIATLAVFTLLAANTPATVTPVGPVPDEDALRQALVKYLAEQGHVCLGKLEWPIDVSQRDIDNNARDAIQMPVLEKLGLVASTTASASRAVGTDGTTATIAVKRYQLTLAGRKSYLNKDVITHRQGASSPEHHTDLCAAKLSLDKLVRWEESDSSTTSRQGTLYYTYHVMAVPWALTPEAQRVFPTIGRVINGEGTLQLQQRMQLRKDGWSALNEVY